MIVDLDGAISEPARRRHVIALSTAAAAISLAFLVAFIAPSRDRDASPRAVAPAPSPTAGAVMMTIDSGATRVTLDQLSQVRGDVTTTACVVGSGPNPSVTLVFDRNGQPIAAYTGGTTGRFIPMPSAHVRTGWLTVPCDTSDVFAPRINRAR